jgi:hypothetical protein
VAVFTKTIHSTRKQHNTSHEFSQYNIVLKHRKYMKKKNRKYEKNTQKILTYCPEMNPGRQAYTSSLHKGKIRYELEADTSRIGFDMLPRRT